MAEFSMVATVCQRGPNFRTQINRLSRRGNHRLGSGHPLQKYSALVEVSQSRGHPAVIHHPQTG